MEERTRDNLKNGFGSLFRNRCCIEAGKSISWWIALIIFIVAIFVPVIPTMVSTSREYGSSFLDGNTYSYEHHLSATMMDLSLEGYKLEIKDVDGAKNSQYLQASINGQSYHPTDEDDLTPIASYVYDGGQFNGEYGLLVYFTERDRFNETTSINRLIDEIEMTTYIRGTTDPYNSGDLFVETYRPSFILFGYHYVYTELMDPSSTEIETITVTRTRDGVSYEEDVTIYAYSHMFSGDWYHHEAGTDLVNDYLSVSFNSNSGFYLLDQDYSNVKVETNSNGEEIVYVTAPTNEEEKDALLRSTSYQGAFAQNWYESFDSNYKTSKNANLLYTTLIYLAIYILIALFMGLLIYLLTRGKNNYYRYLKFGVCEKISAWTALTPGLLAMVLGFLMPSYAIVFFIALYGLRIMWLSMMQLRGS